MKTIKKRLALLVPGLLCFAANVYAQDVPTSEPTATAPYKTAIGLRTSWGGPSGLTSGLSIKHFFWKESALELQVGQGGLKNSYQASLHYIWQPQLLSSSRLRPFAGIGIGAIGRNHTSFGEKIHFEARATLIGTVGVEYTFPKVPISISADYRFHILKSNAHNFESLESGRANSSGVSLKYTFK